MPLSHETITFDVVDCKVYPLTADSVGASPTYGAAVDVPGIQAVSLDMNIVSQELKGDATIIDKRSKLESFKCTLKHAKTSLDVLAKLIGGTVVDAGSTPNQTATWSLNGGTSFPYAKIAWRIEDVDTGIGNCLVTLYKAKITAGKLMDQQTDGYGQPTYDVDAIQPLFASTPLIAVTLYETDGVLPA